MGIACRSDASGDILRASVQPRCVPERRQALA